MLFFFFKQKTAYEIGTGDWSSDVCLPISFVVPSGLAFGSREVGSIPANSVLVAEFELLDFEIGRASCRERV